MKRLRQLSILLFAAAVLVTGLTVTGAFTSVSADRTVDVQVAGDEAAFLSLSPSDSPDGAHARLTDGTLELVFDGSATGVTGNGVNANATTTFDEVFDVTNRGTQPVGVEVTADSQRVEFYADGQRIDDGSGTVALDPGETVAVDIVLDAGTGDALESVENVTIRADAETANDGSGESGGGDDSGGGSGGSSGDVVQATVTENQNGTTRVTTEQVESGTTVEASVDVALDNGVRLNSFGVRLAERGAVNTTIEPTDTDDVPTPPGENATGVTYLAVQHPNLSDAAIENATFTVTVPQELVGDSAFELRRYRPSTDSWQSLETRFLGTTGDTNRYLVRSPGLSLFAGVIESLIRSPETGQPLDAALLDADGNYSADIYETYRQDGINRTFWEIKAEETADDAAGVIREKLRSKLQSYVRGEVEGMTRSAALSRMKRSYPVLSSGMTGALSAYSYGKAAITVMKIGVPLSAGIQRKVVAIHMAGPYSTESYREVRSGLAALEENSRALDAARDAGNRDEARALLEERRTLIEDLYGTLPVYLDDVHTDVVRRSAGSEDLRAYRPVRTVVDSLRRRLVTDYRHTTSDLYGAMPSEPLSETATMPTHGWRARGTAEMFDTLETRDDFAVYRLDATGDEELSVRLEGASVGGFEAVLTNDHPDAPRTASGTPLSDPGVLYNDRQVQTATVEGGVHYLTVRANGTVGPYRMTATSDGDAPGVAVVERPGEDIQRPDLRLVAAPEPYTLQNGRTVRTTNGSDVELVWEAWDPRTDAGDLQYRIRADHGDDFTDWTPWRNATEAGRIEYEESLADGFHRIQIVVRDASEKQAVRNVDVVVSDTEPQTFLTTDDNPESGTIYGLVTPDERIKRVELQYRAVGNDTWTDWKTITDTRDFDVLSFPEIGNYEVRARAVGLGSVVGPWNTTDITYRPPDTTPPSVTLTDAPSRVRIGDERRRLTDAGSVPLAWRVDDAAANASLKYRLRVDGTWREWRNVSADGRIRETLSLEDGGHDVRLDVQDPTGNVRTESVAFGVDTVAPTLSLTATDGTRGALLDPNANEGVRAVAVQIRNESTDWRDLTRIDGGETPISVEPGEYEVRARGTDYAGNTGPWDRAAFTSRPGDGSGTYDPEGSIDGGGSTPVAGGGDDGDGVPVDFGDRGGGTVQVGTFIDEIDGELLLSLYMLTRDGRNVPVDSITVTQEGSATITGDLPPNLTSDARLELRATGNGTVTLDSLRLFSAAFRAPSVSVDRPVVRDENATLAATVPEGAALPTVDWDLDDDGTYEATGPSVDTRFETTGRVTVTARVTDAFGNANATETTLNVTARPTLVIAGNETVATGEALTLDASDSTDDGRILRLAWDRGADGTTDATGQTATFQFPDDGTYDLRVTATDDRGVTAVQNLSVVVTNRPPNARVAPPDETVLVGESVSISAAASADPDGSVASYRWMVDGADAGSGADLRANFTEPGDHRVAVTVTDDDGATNTTTETIHVNRPPRPALSVPESVETLESITLSAAASTDPDGRITDYEWTVRGTDDVRTSGDTATVSYHDDGRYNVTVSVTDDAGTTRSITRTVEVINRPPTAGFEWSPREPTVAESATFDASDSGDRDGTIQRYAWDFDGDGTDEATGRQATHAFDRPGYRTVSLTVTDDDGATNTTSREIYVNAPPEAAATTDGPVKTFESATLSADESLDTDGEITAYEWEIGGKRLDSETATVSFPDDGTYEGTLTVTDDDGATDTAAVTLTVRNRPPNPAVEYRPTVPTVGETVSFDATPSSDRDGRIVGFEWQFGDGTAVADGANVTHTFETPGNRTVELRTTDDDGATNTTTRTVHVNAPPEAALVAPATALTGERVRLNASGSTDPDGEVVAYDWDLNTGAADTAVTSFPDDGNYTVSVTVTDDHGATDTANATVRIRNRPPNATITRESDGTVVPGENVTFQVVATDPDGRVVGYELDSNRSDPPADHRRGNRTAGGGVVAWLSVPIEDAADRRFTFTAIDDDGNETTATFDLAVNDPPRVEFDAPESVTVGESFTVESEATDPDGTLTAYEWTAIDGQGNRIANGTGETATFEVGYETTVEIHHSVTDDDGTTRVSETSVDVVESEATLDVWTERFLSGRLVTLDGDLEGPNYDSVPYESARWTVGTDSSAIKNGTTVALFGDEPRNTSATITFDLGNRTREAETRVETDPSGPALTADWAVGDPLSTGRSCSICVRDGRVSDRATGDRYTYLLTANDTASRVTAVDRATGTVQWTTTTEPGWQLAVSGDGVYVAGDGSGVTRLDADTGSVVWTYDATTEAIRVRGGTVLVPEYDQSAETDSSTLTALDATTGDREWSWTFDDYPAAVATDDGVAVETNGTLQFLSLSGERQWATETDHRYPQLEAGHGHLYVRSDGNMTVLDLTTGARVATFDGVEQVQPVRDGVVVAWFDGGNTGIVQEWNFTTESREWQETVAVTDRWNFEALNTSGDTAMILYEPADTVGTELLRIDRENGTVESRFQPPIDYAYRVQRFDNVTVVSSSDEWWYRRDDGTTTTLGEVPYNARAFSDGLVVPTEQGLIRVSVDRLD